MKPDDSVIEDGAAEKGRAWALVEPGRAYAIYLVGSGPTELTLELPEGAFRAEWINPGVLLAAERRVGFMGQGLIGLAAAQLVRDTGFHVAAWTRRPRDEPGIESFHGEGGLAPFLARSEILVNLLPLTEHTSDILCARTLAMLPEGAVLINLGRGQHVVDDDLIEALDSGRLRAATLDVFRTEPLPAAHPFWSHPAITVMPHTARRPRAENAVPQVVENIRRLRAGTELMQVVDRDAGY